MKRVVALLLLSGFFTFMLAAVGKIVIAEGKVFVERGAKVSPAAVGFELEEKDTVKTEGVSKASIKFTDGTSISIGKDTIFNINEYVYGEDANNYKADLKVSEGLFSATSGMIGKLAPKKFQMGTATSTIGIRGTEFGGKINPLFEKIFCTSGAIAVTAGGQTVEVMAGMSTTIEPGKAPTPPAESDKAEVEEVTESTGAKEAAAVEETSATEPEQKTETKEEAKEETKEESKTTQETKTEESSSLAVIDEKTAATTVAETKQTVVAPVIAQATQQTQTVKFETPKVEDIQKAAQPTTTVSNMSALDGISGGTTTALDNFEYPDIMLTYFPVSDFYHAYYYDGEYESAYPYYHFDSENMEMKFYKNYESYNAEQSPLYTKDVSGNIWGTTDNEYDYVAWGGFKGFENISVYSEDGTKLLYQTKDGLITFFTVGEYATNIPSSGEATYTIKFHGGAFNEAGSWSSSQTMHTYTDRMTQLGAVTGSADLTINFATADLSAVGSMYLNGAKLFDFNIDEDYYYNSLSYGSYSLYGQSTSGDYYVDIWGELYGPGATETAGEFWYSKGHDEEDSEHSYDETTNSGTYSYQGGNGIFVGARGDIVGGEAEEETTATLEGFAVGLADSGSNAGSYYHTDVTAEKEATANYMLTSDDTTNLDTGTQGYNSDDYTYVKWGLWNSGGAADVTTHLTSYFNAMDHVMNAFVVGNPTAQMPTAGSATYTGGLMGVKTALDGSSPTEISGTVSLTASFATGQISGGLDIANFGQFNFNANNAITGNRFDIGTNNITNNGSNGTNDGIIGMFYGSSAAEVGGAFKLHNSDNTAKAGGVFIGKQGE